MESCGNGETKICYRTILSCGLRFFTVAHASLCWNDTSLLFSFCVGKTLNNLLRYTLTPIVVKTLNDLPNCIKLPAFRYTPPASEHSMTYISVFNVRSTLNFTKNLRMPLSTPQTSMIE